MPASLLVIQPHPLVDGDLNYSSKRDINHLRKTVASIVIIGPPGAAKSKSTIFLHGTLDVIPKMLATKGEMCAYYEHDAPQE